MDNLVIGVLGIVLMVILLVLRFYLGLAMYIVGFLGFWLIIGDLGLAFASLARQPYETASSYMLVVLPLFILMGIFVGEAGLSSDAYTMARIWTGKVRGGLAMATVVANTLFGAACGSSVAACAVFTKFSLPEMTKYGYKPSFAGATIAGAGTLAMLIPPSMLGILFGILSETSIGALFIGGVGPGLLLTVFFIVGIMIMVRANPSIAPVSPASFTWRQKLLAIRRVWGIAVLAILVLGGIYGGIFTPQEAGAIGAFGAFLIAIFNKKISRKILMSTLKDTSGTCAMTFFMLLGAIYFGRFLAMSGLPNAVANAVLNANVPPMVVLLSIVIMYLIMGCFMQSNPIMIITVPVIFPISEALGWDPVWFGLITIMTLEIGLLTPPVALNVFVVKAVAGDVMTMDELFKACLPFLCIMMVTLAFMIVFPPIVTWLPGLMK